MRCDVGASKIMSMDRKLSTPGIGTGTLEGRPVKLVGGRLRPAGGSIDGSLAMAYLFDLAACGNLDVFESVGRSPERLVRERAIVSWLVTNSPKTLNILINPTLYAGVQLASTRKRNHLNRSFSPRQSVIPACRIGGSKPIG